jgi:hypothetical protein
LGGPFGGVGGGGGWVVGCGGHFLGKVQALKKDTV